MFFCYKPISWLINCFPLLPVLCLLFPPIGDPFFSNIANQVTVANTVGLEHSRKMRSYLVTDAQLCADTPTLEIDQKPLFRFPRQSLDEPTQQRNISFATFGPKENNVVWKQNMFPNFELQLPYYPFRCSRDPKIFPTYNKNCVYIKRKYRREFWRFFNDKLGEWI